VPSLPRAGITVSTTQLLIALEVAQAETFATFNATIV
jgi:hypothetical protein